MIQKNAINTKAIELNYSVDLRQLCCRMVDDLQKLIVKQTVHMGSNEIRSGSRNDSEVTPTDSVDSMFHGGRESDGERLPDPE